MTRPSTALRVLLSVVGRLPRVREGAGFNGGAERVAARDRYTRPVDLGSPEVNLDSALEIAADLEDEELMRRMRGGE